MAIQSMQLDPNAAAYTDDEIVGKVNSATAKVSADKLEDGTMNKIYTDTEKSKLGGIEENAKADPTGDEIVAAINAGSAAINREGALDQAGLKIVKTNPAVGECQIKNIHRDTSGKMDIEYDDVPES